MVPYYKLHIIYIIQTGDQKFACGDYISSITLVAKRWPEDLFNF